MNNNNTAVCHVQCGVADGADDDETVDETRRNTWHNETVFTSDTPISCSTPSDLHDAASTTTSGTTFFTNTNVAMTGRSAASSGTSPASDTSALSVASMPTSRSGDAAHAESGYKKSVPFVPPKPALHARPTATACSPRQPRPSDEQATSTTATDERSALLARVHALEQVWCRKCVF